MVGLGRRLRAAASAMEGRLAARCARWACKLLMRA